MTYTFSELFQDVMSDLGKSAQFEQFLATSGSTTQIENIVIAARESQPDDNYSVDYTAVVVRDAGGAGAAPEGQLQRVSAYDSATNKYTVDTAFTAAVAAGDEIMLVNADIPLREFYRIANRALTEYEVTNVNSSLVMTNTGKYTLPAGVNRNFPVQLAYADSSDEMRIPFVDWKISADGYLFVPHVENRKIYLTYVGPHAPLTAYNSPISEDIHPQLAVAAATVYALRWLLNSQAGESQFWIQRYNEALQDKANIEMKFPIKRYLQQPRWFSIR